MRRTLSAGPSKRRSRLIGLESHAVSAVSPRIATALAIVFAVGVALVRVATVGPRAPRATAPTTSASRSTSVVRAFYAELAVDFATQVRGLSGRPEIDPEGGMLFAYPEAKPLIFVMRDCLAPIDIAFLDADARVVAIHSMAVEAPRQPWESPSDYQGRLQPYASGAPAQYAFESAGGRLAELGVRVGDRARFDRDGVLAKLGGARR